ncbi:MAG: Ig-like domain-containing protein, partial [Alloprevotella sp.]
FSFLLVACLATVGAWAQTPVVRSLDDLQNGAAYTIESEGRGYLIYDASKDASRAWCSNNTTNGPEVPFDSGNLCHLWTFYKSANGGCYLYNLGAQKFLYKDASVGGTTFSLEPLGSDVTFKPSTSPSRWGHEGDIENYPVVIAFGDNEINLSTDQNPSVFTNWNDTGDTGNIMRIVWVTDVFEKQMMAIEAAVTEYEVKPITDFTTLDNGKAYFVKTARGQWAYDPAYSFTTNEETFSGENFLVSSTASGVSATLDDANKGFVLLKTYHGKYRLWSVGAQKFVGLGTQVNDNPVFSNTSLSAEPLLADTLTFLNGTAGNAKYPTVIAINGQQLGISNSYGKAGGLIAGYNDVSDQGNNCGIYESTLTPSTASLLALAGAVEAPVYMPSAIAPADGETVTSLKTFTFTLQEQYDMTGSVWGTKAKLLNSKGEEIAEASMGYDYNQTVTFTLPEEITKGGTYTLVVPEKTFGNKQFSVYADDCGISNGGTWNAEMRLTYTISTPPANTLAYTTVAPENESTLTKGLETATLTYADELGFADGTPIDVLNAAGETVATATLAVSTENASEAVLTLSEKLTENGTYTINVPEGYIYNNLYDAEADDKGVADGALYNPAFTLTFTVDYKATLTPTVTPDSETPVESLASVTLTFEKPVTYDESKTISIFSRMQGSYTPTVEVSADDATQVVLTLAEPIASRGLYMLSIPEEAFTAEDGTFNPEVNSQITVTPPANTFMYDSTTPANGAKVAVLDTVKFTYSCWAFPDNFTAIDVLDANGETVTTSTLAYDDYDYNSVNLVLATPIEAAGTYTINVPEQYIYDEWYNEFADDKGISSGATYNPAYTLSFTVTGPYPVNFDKDMNRTRTDRTLNSVTLTESGKSGQTVTLANTSKIYNDQHETAVLTCTAGSTLTATFNYTGTWMHGYVYIDTENDNAFSFNEGSTDQSGTDLKAFAFYSGDFNNDASGYNSAGESISGDARANINPPSFTAPTTPGTYRIRFKVDWNSVDPGGQLAADATIFGHNGIGNTGGYILDATLEVVEPSPLAPLTPTSVTPAAGETVGSFTAATLTFDTDINYDSEKTVSIYDRSYNTYTATVTVEGNTATISVEGPITQTGYYTIDVPASTFTTEEGRSNEAFTTSFIVQAPANSFEYESVSPANGMSVASLNTITLTYSENVNGTIINDSPIEVKDAEGNTVTTATLSTDNNIWNIVRITLASEIKTNGTYTLTIPEEFIGNEAYIGSQPDKGAGLGGKYNPAFTLTYTVDITLGIDSLTIDNAAGKTIYSIDGRQVSGKLQRGTYIINGQKRFVK